MTRQILLGIDAGGTFTDFVSVELGERIFLKVHKTLSTPRAPEQAILTGIEAMGLTARLQAGGLHIIHGSTVATNAVLERKVARTAFITNRGFGDMLQLARQTRPKLYALEFEPVEPPVPAGLCLETGGRLGADGAVVEALSEADIRELTGRIKALAPEAVAINLLFSFLDARFERVIEEAIHEAGLDVFVSRSSDVLPVYKEYERGIATWLNACLGPIVSGYLARLQERLGDSSLQIMQSNGETIAADKAADSAVHLLLSGPAGGLTAIRFLGRQISLDRIISFDMGGTSTDVALLDGDITTSSEGHIDRYPVGVPMVDMHTIGAGGGSIAFIDSGGMLQVGPRSAGADPGPTCYGKGGTEATVTDANLVLGRLIPEAALAGSLQLNLPLARAAIARLAEPIGLGVEETAEGIVSIANEHMAEAIRLISVNRGHDPKEFLLASFGGAGGLHVCAIAETMQMNKAIVPAYGGVLSALGMLVANRGRQFSKTIGQDTQRLREKVLEDEFAQLADHGREQLQAEGLAAGQLVVKTSVDMRYQGQSYTLNVDFTDLTESVSRFHDLHRKRYGYALHRGTEIVNLCVKVLHQGEGFALPTIPAPTDCNNIRHGRVYGHAGPAAIVARAEIAAGQEIEGPAIVTEYSATTFIAPDWVGCRDDYGNLLLSKKQ